MIYKEMSIRTKVLVMNIFIIIMMYCVMWIQS